MFLPTVADWTKRVIAALVMTAHWGCLYFAGKQLAKGVKFDREGGEMILAEGWAIEGLA